MVKTSTKPMKAVIFAGGIGTRMWPLSREATPKQFEKIIDGKSTLQLAVGRLAPEFKPEDIYISTGKRYVKIVEQQLPDIPPGNIIGEPEMRDVAPAVGYLMAILEKNFNGSPVAILWSDHLVANVDEFKTALLSGGEYLSQNPDKIVFLGQKPRFASQNLGWIEYGKDISELNGLKLREFVSWHYRPDLPTAHKYFTSANHAWNPGYFIVTPKFVMSQFKKHAPEMYGQLKQLQDAFPSAKHEKLLAEIYPKFDKVSFDNLILEKIAPEEAVVISVDLGWSDVGAWEALKEALQSSPESNITHGNVKNRNTTDSLVYSYTDQLVTTIDLEGMIIVVTPDVILVTKKDSIPEVKKLVGELKDSGLDQYT
jgi:mannose-1-phosphate guanylyltransferase